MSKAKVIQRPSYVMGILIALGGLLLAWVLPNILPEGLRSIMAGAITGGFGVAAAGRLWPGLPLREMIIYGPAVAAYGVIVGLLAGG